VSGNTGSMGVIARRFAVVPVVLGCLFAMVAVFAGRAEAAPATGWSVLPTAPTYFVPGGRTSLYYLEITNSAPAEEVTINDTLPAGMEVESVSFYWSQLGTFDLNALLGGSVCPLPTGRQLTCHFAASGFGLRFEPGYAIRVAIRVKVPVSTPEGPIVNEAVVEGGGLADASVSSQSIISAHPSFGIANLTFQPTEATKVMHLPTTLGKGKEAYEIVNEPYKQPFTQAGGHPWALTTKIELATEARIAPSSSEGSQGDGQPYVVPVRDPKDITADLPPGLLGDPLAVPRCSLVFITGSTPGRCPADTQIGYYRLGVGGTNEIIGPIVNVTPEVGQSAEFALEYEDKGAQTPLLTAHLVRRTERNAEGREVEGYGFDVADNAVVDVGLRSVELTLWGVPSDPSHNALRGIQCRHEGIVQAVECPAAGGEVSNLPQVPFLSLPTDCSNGPQSLGLHADSWQEPGAYTEKTAVFPAVTGCNMLSFDAGTGIGVEPDTQAPDEPVGLGVNLKVPLNESPETNTTPAVRDITATLPEGMSVSPGVVDGIKACNATGPEGINITGPESEEISKLTGEPQLTPGHCPDASIVGTAEAISPLLQTPVKGHIYLARPGCGGPEQNPCTEQDVRDGNLYRLYLELGGTGQFANTGIEFKVPLETEVNPATGQLTAVSKELVQAPYNEVRIHLNGGPRAPLANPAVCGPATSTADFTPWSAPGLTPEGSSVAGSANVLSSSFFEVEPHGCPDLAPFAPGFTAGTVIPQAGQYSAFTMNLSRQDREQYVKGIQIHTPPGLLGMLSSVPLCPDDQANDPSRYGQCTASKIGTTRVATGAGSHPFEIEGNVYLTGPYEGAPFGLSIVTNAVAGPFNLGNVVVRARIDVNPNTAALTVTSDPFPQILDGIPLRLRTANVTIERPGFIFNPTDCAQLKVEATISSAQGAQANVSAPFAVAGCAGLHFGPTFKVSTSGKTSRADGASLAALLSFPSGPQSNVAHVKVELPKALPSRLTTLQKACKAATFEANPAACPPASLVGIARATTPVLPVALTGPAYFVSHGGEAFPSLIVVLQGYGVRIDLIGDTFISKAGITSSTFENVPDVQVSSFELYLPEGPDSALAANGNLCKQKLSMPSTFTAQDGAQLKQNVKIQVTGCPTAKKATAASAAKRGKVGRAGEARRSSHGQGRRA